MQSWSENKEIQQKVSMVQELPEFVPSNVHILQRNIVTVDPENKFDKIPPPGMTTNEVLCAPDTTSHAIFPSNHIFHGK